MYQYEMFVDKNASFARRQVELEKRTFYGQLCYVWCFTLPASIELDLAEPTTLVMAAIRGCRINSTGPTGLDIFYYADDGAIDVVDVESVQALVARVWVPNRKEWAIIDRSGLLGAVADVN
jgi:hypothetical protein